MKKLLFIVNVDWFFVSHRLPIAIRAQKQNYEIHLITAFTDKFEYLRRNGFILHNLNIDRKSRNIFSSVAYIISISKLLIKIKPDLIHLITIKPLLLAGLASRLLNFLGLISTKGIVIAITGFGSVFAKDSIFSRIQKALILLFFKITYINARRIKYIFQNKDDKEKLSKFLIIDKNNSIIIKGSGIDLEKYNVSEFPKNKFNVLFAARLLRSKGLIDFIDSSKYIDGAQFFIAGRYDPDSIDYITPEILMSLIQSHNIKFLGNRNNMHEIIPLMSLVVLPSYYKEGLPKILIEAAACGRPIITTDTPGCRDAIIEGISGILVPPKQPKILAIAIKSFINDTNKCIEMGSMGRKFAERNFDINKVVEKHLECYEELYSK